MNARPATPEDYRADNQPVPVPVHVASIAGELGAGLGPGGPPRQARKSGVYHTVTLTAGEGAQEILPASTTRDIAWVTAIDADVFIDRNLSDAAAGRGAYLPCVTPSTGKPSLGGPFPVEDSAAVFAAVVTPLAGTNTARVSVVAYHRDT